MKVYFVLGEASGDALAAPLLGALRERAPELEAVGLAGPQLSAAGLASLFDIEEVAVMGIGPVIARLPRIVRRVWDVVRDVRRQQPDVLVIVDSPDFTHAVAKRVRRAMPDLPVVNYVCPSVWAWRSGRARAMRGYVDHVLALLPFEPTVLEELGGPPATYVGHPLAAIAEGPPVPATPGRLLVLPGSRRSEHDRLLPVFRETLAVLQGRNVAFDAVMPTLPRFEDELRAATGTWPVPVDVVRALPHGGSFEGAQAALAASGTVSLELALRGVPMVLAYRTDAVVRSLSSLIDTWSAALPNLVADRVVVPENIDAFARPQRLARQVQDLLSDTPARAAQVAGLADVRAAVRTDVPASQRAAEIVLRVAQRASSAT